MQSCPRGNLQEELSVFYYELMPVEDNGFRVMHCFIRHLSWCLLHPSSREVPMKTSDAWSVEVVRNCASLVCESKNSNKNVKSVTKSRFSYNFWLSLVPIPYSLLKSISRFLELDRVNVM